MSAASCLLLPGDQVPCQAGNAPGGAAACRAHPGVSAGPRTRAGLRGQPGLSQRRSGGGAAVPRQPWSGSSPARCPPAARCRPGTASAAAPLPARGCCVSRGGADTAVLRPRPERKGRGALNPQFWSCCFVLRLCEWGFSCLFSSRARCLVGPGGSGAEGAAGRAELRAQCWGEPRGHCGPVLHPGPQRCSGSSSGTARSQRGAPARAPRTALGPSPSRDRWCWSRNA